MLLLQVLVTRSTRVATSLLLYTRLRIRASTTPSPNTYTKVLQQHYTTDPLLFRVPRTYYLLQLRVFAATVHKYNTAANIVFYALLQYITKTARNARKYKFSSKSIRGDTPTPRMSTCTRYLVSIVRTGLVCNKPELKRYKHYTTGNYS